MDTSDRVDFQSCLVEIARQYGKPVETVDADLARAVEEYSCAIGFFLSKEELARAIVQLNEAAGTSLAEMEKMQANIQRIAAETALRGSAKARHRTERTPYYHKDKTKWWK